MSLEYEFDRLQEIAMREFAIKLKGESDAEENQGQLQSEK